MARLRPLQAVGQPIPLQLVAFAAVLPLQVAAEAGQVPHHVLQEVPLLGVIFGLGHDSLPVRTVGEHP